LFRTRRRRLVDFGRHQRARGAKPGEKRQPHELRRLGPEGEWISVFQKAAERVERRHRLHVHGNLLGVRQAAVQDLDLEAGQPCGRAGGVVVAVLIGNGLIGHARSPSRFGAGLGSKYSRFAVRLRLFPPLPLVGEVARQWRAGGSSFFTSPEVIKSSRRPFPVRETELGAVIVPKLELVQV
jgi:hypothetical protein